MVTKLLQPFYGPLDFAQDYPVSRYQKRKTNLNLLEQQTVSGSGISWAICRSAPGPRQTTMPGQMPFLPPNQQCQSTVYRVHKKVAAFANGVSSFILHHRKYIFI